MSSCGSINGETGIKAMRISGILTEQSSNDPNPGTHLLSGDDMKVYPVSSILLKLSDAKYLGNKVELIGSYDSDSNLFSVSGISVVEVLNKEDESDVVVETLDYKNTDFGIETKIPSDFTIVEEDESLVFVSPAYESDGGDVFDTIEFSQSPFRYDSSVFDAEKLDSPLKNFMSANFPELSNIDLYSSKIGPDLLDAIRIENSFGGDDVYLYRNGIIYKISFLPKNSLSVNSDNARIFDEMLSNFKFVGFTVEENFDDSIEEFTDNSALDSLTSAVISLDYNLSDFAAFESKPYNFKAFYPKQWYYEGISTGEPGVQYSYVFADNDTPSMDPAYSLSVVSSVELSSFKNIQVNGVDLQYFKDSSTYSVYREVNGKKFLCKGDSTEEDKILATILNLSLL
jgi:hypothetical protein